MWIAPNMGSMIVFQICFLFRSADLIIFIYFCRILHESIKSSIKPVDSSIQLVKIREIEGTRVNTSEFCIFYVIIYNTWGFFLFPNDVIILLHVLRKEWRRYTNSIGTLLRKKWGRIMITWFSYFCGSLHGQMLYLDIVSSLSPFFSW